MIVKKIIFILLKIGCFLSFIICVPIVLLYAWMYYESFKNSDKFGLEHFLKCAFNNCYDNMALEDFDGFRFIDYQVPEDAEASLLKLHPVNSETKSLTERFKRLHILKSKSTDDMSCKIILLMQHHEQPTRPLNLVNRDWNITVCDNDGLIQSIKLRLVLTGL